MTFCSKKPLERFFLRRFFHRDSFTGISLQKFLNKDCHDNVEMSHLLNDLLVATGTGFSITEWDDTL